MSDFIFKISPNIMLGSYLSARLGQYAKDWGNHFMVIIDQSLKKLDVESKIRNSLEECKIDFFTVDDLPVCPASSDVERILKLARDAKIQGVISVGSEKIINFAKCISAFYNETESVYDILDSGSIQDEALPLICVPTYMKDEFLFSNRIPVIDSRSNTVILLNAQNALCKLALFDPTISSSMTQDQFFSSFLCLLCITIEAYISQKANFFSDTIIEKAVELLYCGIENMNLQSDSLSPETYLAEGACMTSIGAALSGWGPATLLSMMIEGSYHISSQISSVILFPYIIEDAAKYKNERIAKISRIMKLSTSEISDEDAKNALLDYIHGKIAENNLPSSLKSLSISIDQLALISDACGKLDVIDGFPRSMSSDDLFSLVKQAY